MIETNNKLLSITTIAVAIIPAMLAFIILESGILLVIIVFSCIFGSVALYWKLDKYCPFNAGHDFHVKPKQDYTRQDFIVYCVKCNRERMEYLPSSSSSSSR